jgi:hypothetical protein
MREKNAKKANTVTRASFVSEEVKKDVIAAMKHKWKRKEDHCYAVGNANKNAGEESTSVEKGADRGQNGANPGQDGTSTGQDGADGRVDEELNTDRISANDEINCAMNTTDLELFNTNSVTEDDELNNVNQSTLKDRRIVELNAPHCNELEEMLDSEFVTVQLEVESRVEDTLPVVESITLVASHDVKLEDADEQVEADPAAVPLESQTETPGGQTGDDEPSLTTPQR